jgi:moderate conductance mechanosensitive channel
MLEIVTTNLVIQLEKIAELLGQWLSDHLINIIVILIGAWIVRHFSSKLIGSLLRHTVRPDLYPTKADREKRIKTLNSLVGAAVRVGVYIIAALLIVGEINPGYTTALFASAGLIGVAIGFGAKDIVNDFMSGIFVIMENQYRVGDVVSAGGVSGIVEDITIRTTVLRDLDGHVHHIPNGSIGVTTNMTIGYSQVNEDILVGYDADLDQVEHIINHVGEEMAADPEFQYKITEPPKVMRVDGFGDNGIVIKVVGKTVSGEQWAVKGELYKRLKPAFDKHHIEIPYQHVVVHSKKS